MQINLGEATNGERVFIDIPSLISTRLLVTASSGGGKSETLRRILEEAVGKVQCIVIDPEGEFSTLREKYPFVLVGEGGETPSDIRSASLVATRLLELNASAICDLYEMRVHERHEWVKRFLDAMIHAPKNLWHPVIVIVDEAHTYCPERGYGESVASQAVIDLCNLGRKRGFCAVLATQRISKLNKNAVEPLQNYLVGRTTYDDQKRAAAIFKIDPGTDTRKFSLELEQLNSGQFIARGRSITGDMLRVNVTRGTTRPPATGAALAGIVTPTPDAIKGLLPQLADLPKEAEKKAKTEEDLRRELSEAKHRIAQLERSSVPNEAQSAEIESLRTALADSSDVCSALKTGNEQLTSRLNKLLKFRDSLRNLADAMSEEEVENPVVPVIPKTVPPPVKFFSIKSPQTVNHSHNGSVNLRAGALRMLAALAQWYPSGRTEAQLASQVQMKRTGGTWAAYKSDLRKEGFLEVRDGLWFATDAGRGYVGNDTMDTPTTTDEVVRLWGEKLRKGAREMLDVLVNHKGRTVTREQLGRAISMEHTGGTFAAYLSDLKQAGLIQVGRDGIAADREALFL